MNEQKIEELKNALRELMQMIVQRGQPLTPELKEQLFQVMQHVANRIEELRNESPNLSATPPLDQAPYPSSNVNSFKYDPKNGTLFVKFHGQDSANSGSVYRYENVPKNIYDVFSKGMVAPKTSGQNQYHRWIKGVTPSLGASLYALIRNSNFPYQKIR